MRAIIQRVSEASVDVDNISWASIGAGLVLLVGVHVDDTIEDAVRLADKIVGLRIFSDADGKMNLSIKQMGPEFGILAVSNFTVYGDSLKSRRPSFLLSAPYSVGEELFGRFVKELRKGGVSVKTGQFGADMKVRISNDGPVTLVGDTR